MTKDRRRHRRKSHSPKKKKIIRPRSSSESSNGAGHHLPGNSPSRYRSRQSSASSSHASSRSRSSSSTKKRVTSDGLLSAPELPPEGLKTFEDKPKSIALYIDNREDMTRQMFSSLHRNELRELLPESMKNMKMAKLLSLCIVELNAMSKKRICAILEGKDFVEGSESEEEMNTALAVSASSKTSKTEVAVADSTTEVTSSNSASLPTFLPDTVERRNANSGSAGIDSLEVHALQSSLSAEALQQSETIQEQHPVRGQAEKCLNRDTDQDNADVVTANEDGDDLEEGEVVSGQDTDSNPSMTSTPSKKRSHNRLSITDKDKSVPTNPRFAPMLKSSGSDGRSTSGPINVRQETKLNVLELELRARAIEALMKRSGSRP